MIGLSTIPGLIYIVLKQLKLENVIVTMAYENDIKPTPLEMPIVAIGGCKMDIGERLSKVADDGSITLTNSREQTLQVKIGFYVPYSYGAVGCYQLHDDIIERLMSAYKTIIQSVCCGEVNYVRDTGGLVLDSVITIKQTLTFS